MHAAPAAPGPASPPDPQPDRSGSTIPERIAALLHVVRILLGYGRHLAETVKDRAAAPSFTSIAACFGTADLAVIIAHLHRGILRAVALERVLLARAASGRDVDFVEARSRVAARQPAPADAAANQPAAAPAARTAASRPSRCSRRDDPADFHIPTLEELEAQVRRRPLGRTIVDICLDLAVVPGFCTGPFWNALFDTMRWYGGSVTILMQERLRREEAFEQEQDRSPTRSWDWLDQSREKIRQVLGFFIGEEPADPFGLSPAPGAPAAAVATGPP